MKSWFRPDRCVVLGCPGVGSRFRDGQTLGSLTTGTLRTRQTLASSATAMLLFFALLASQTCAEDALPVFTDVTEEAGITAKHSFGDFELSNIVEGSGAGATFFDYDGDGHLDIYLVNGCWHPDASDSRGRSLRGKLSNTLYRNKGDGTFADVTKAAGVGHQGFGIRCLLRGLRSRRRSGSSTYSTTVRTSSIATMGMGRSRMSLRKPDWAIPAGACREPGSTTMTTAIWTCTWATI